MEYLDIERIRKAQEGDPYDLKDLVPSAPIIIPAIMGWRKAEKRFSP